MSYLWPQDSGNSGSSSQRRAWERKGQGGPLPMSMERKGWQEFLPSLGFKKFPVMWSEKGVQSCHGTPGIPTCGMPLCGSFNTLKKTIIFPFKHW